MPVKRFNEHPHVLRKLGVSAICDKQVRLMLKDILSISAQAIQQSTHKAPGRFGTIMATVKASIFGHWGVFQVGFCGRLYQRVFEPLPEFTHIPPSPLGNCNLNFLPRIAFTSIMWKSWIGSGASLAAHTCEERLFCADL